ncbi:MAG: ferrous iron transporter B [Clostridia bacterium]|nr:ferrous iron transporter B [Clostridia bacterium]
MALRTAALVGNQNAGKSTLFNRLTGGTAQVGNWPGVTVEQRSGRMRDVTLVDLPGVYALSAFSPEEAITGEFLRSGQADVIVSVADGTCLDRSLYLTLQLAALRLPMVLAINMMDEVQRRGGKLDAAKLSAKLGIPVIPVSGRSGEGVSDLAKAIRSSAAVPVVPHFPEEEPAASAGRYRYIDDMLASCVVAPCEPDLISDRLDSVMLHPYLSVVCLGIILLSVLTMTCGAPAQMLAERVVQCFALCADHMADWMTSARVTSWLKELVLEGLLPGVGSVLSFAPMMFLLFLCMTVLENSGCMARISFLLDKPMRAVGLSGKSIFPLLMGCGCSVTAVLASRSVPDASERRRAIRIMPFVPCSAKLPICMMLSASFFPDHAPLMMLCMILGLFLLAVFAGLWMYGGEKERRSSVLLELPPWRTPGLRGVMRTCLHHMGDFLRRVASVILLSSAVVWLLRSYAPDFSPVSQLSESMLGMLSACIAPLLRPAGFGSPEAAAALITGLLAKENVVSTLHILCDGRLGALFPSSLSAMSFAAFMMIYSPCTAALSAISAEVGKRTAWGIAAMQTLLAWGIAVCIRAVGGMCIA